MTPTRTRTPQPHAHRQEIRPMLSKLTRALDMTAPAVIVFLALFVSLSACGLGA